MSHDRGCPCGREKYEYQSCTDPTCYNKPETKEPVKKNEPRSMYAEENENSVIGYMCMIDYECELGAASGGNRVYPSIEDLKEHHKCWESCGIVEVKVSYVRTIAEQNFDFDYDDGT